MRNAALRDVNRIGYAFLVNRDADLALMDSAFVDGRDDSPGIHLSGSRAATAVLAAGGVRRMVLTHIPPWNDPEVCRAAAAAIWTGPLDVATQGATFEVGGSA